jgi:MoaA/NifB/PqqE/SkfB family radical SAM enzyme
MEVYKIAELGLAYAQSLWAYHTEGDPHPFSASFAVTNKCNLQCSYCNCPNLKTPELTLPQIEILFAKLKKMGVIRLGLLGGEPLVRKDIGDVIAIAKKMNFFISMNTNLLLYKKYEAVLDPVDYFFTSLDGSPEKHIANRGHHDYGRILEAIRSIVEKKRKVTAICVVTDPDYEAVDYLMNLARKEKIDIHLQPECYDAENTKRSAPSSLENNAMRDYWKHIKELKSKGAPITSSHAYLDYLTGWQNYSQTAVYDPTTKCAAGLGYIFIDSSGFTFPCPYTKGHVPGVNLLETSWADGFNPRTPCTKCIVGPMLEFNLLFEKPVRSLAGTFSKIS